MDVLHVQRTISISIHADAHNYIHVHIHVAYTLVRTLLAYCMYLLLSTDSISIITKPLNHIVLVME